MRAALYHVLCSWMQFYCVDLVGYIVLCCDIGLVTQHLLLFFVVN